MADPVTFTQFLESFAQFGGFTGILPFVLTFVIFYGVVTDNIDFLQDRQQVIISLVMALFVSWFLVQNPFYQSFFAGYFGRIAIGAVGLLGFMMLLGLLGVRIDKEIPILIILMVIAAAGAFTLSGGVFAFLPSREILLGYSLADVYSVVFETGLLYLGIIGGFLYWAVVTAPEDKEMDTGERLIRSIIGRDGGEP